MSQLNTSHEKTVASGSFFNEATTLSAQAAAAPDNKATETTSTVIPEAAMAVLERLARQVEYYFSTANLEKDTYMATLRSLNDGYVPLSIIANFGKVRSLVPYDSLNAVRRASIDYSELLEVVHINTQTGKRLDDETVAMSPQVQTVEAVGPTSGEPIPMSSITQIPISPPVMKPVNTAPVQNTLIIREVPQGTDESQIRNLFAFEKCPCIQSLHLDVANCWFITLDTQSKDDMIDVMFELRSKKFPSGESVKARLKSAVVMTPDVSPAHTRYIQSDTPTSFAPQLHSIQHQHGNKKGNANKKKKNGTNPSNAGKGIGFHNINGNGIKSINSNNANSQRQNNNSNNGPKKNNKKNNSLRHDGKKSEAPPQTPPTMGEDQFPSLFGSDIISNKKIEVEKVPEHRPDDDMEMPSGGSDSASTATTTSSSSSSKNASSSSQPFGGYAAALLKTAPPVKTKPSGKEAQIKLVHRKDDGKKNSGQNQPFESKAKKDIKKESLQANPTSAKPESKVVSTPTWGRGRTFADVLRKEAGAAVAAAPLQCS